ncbi:hypothetical protein [Luethyella okanaganae]|uniref:Uncharacterized protein n=1 Tax=Luethyella okanaganae TaxID=69372 RepID=A0ABW1VEX3_9MICO
MPLDEMTETAKLVVRNVESVIDGKHGAVRTALTVLLAGGHLLVEEIVRRIVAATRVPVGSPKRG